MTSISSRTDKILVVDDDARIRDLLRRYLTQEGFEVFQAEDGKSLTRILLRETVDLIVLDLMMPGEDGLSICRRLRAANDTGIQALLRSAAHDDILVLLHSSEQDAALKEKLYSNMSGNSIKMYVEDLLFEFREGVPGYRFDSAMLRLIDTVEAMTRAGTLTIGKPPR